MTGGLVSLDEAARAMGCGRENVRRLLRAGRVEGVKDRDGRWLVDTATLRRRRRWPLEPVEALARVEVLGRLDHDRGTGRAVADLFGVHVRQLYRWREYGLDEYQADRLATRLGLHPAEVWPDW